MTVPRLLPLIALAPILLPGQQQARPNFFGLPPAPNPASVERGEKLFVSNCGFCHGSTGKGGNNGPDLVRSVLVLHDEGSGVNIGPVILEGRAARGMPKFNVSGADVADISAYLMSRSQATVLRSEYKILNLVTGDAAKGQSYFETNCRACHSPAGDLAHIAAKYDPPTLQGRFLYPRARTTPRAQLNATVTLPSGQTISGLVDAIDDFSVSLTDSAGQYRTVPIEEGNGIKVVVRDPLEGHEKLLKRYTDADMHNILAYLVTLK